MATEPKLERVGGRRNGLLERRFDGLPEGELHLSVRPPVIMFRASIRYLWFLLHGSLSSPVFQVFLVVCVLAVGFLTRRRRLRQR